MQSEKMNDVKPKDENFRNHAMGVFLLMITNAIVSVEGIYSMNAYSRMSTAP